jgi:hypothetical protein
MIGSPAAVVRKVTSYKTAGLRTHGTTNAAVIIPAATSNVTVRRFLLIRDSAAHFSSAPPPRDRFKQHTTTPVTAPRYKDADNVALVRHILQKKILVRDVECT